MNFTNFNENVNKASLNTSGAKQNQEQGVATGQRHMVQRA
jgi:hypothetical protein